MPDLPVNLVDVAVLVLVGFAIWTGYGAGFVATTYSLATWVLAAAAAIVFTGPATAVIAAIAGVPKPLASSIAFVLVVLVVEALFSFTGHLAVRPIVALVRRSPLNVVERILGIPPSVVRSLFIAAVAVTALVSLPLSSDLKAAVETSRFGRVVSAQIAALQPQLQALTAQLGGVPLLVTKIGEDETEKLDLPDGLQLAPDPVAERQLFDLVNDERAQRGLAALAWDTRLVPIARAHSEEMFRLKYFGHQSPTSGSPFDRLKKAGITYSRAGENLAYAQSVAVAHQGLMESPGHRENILRPEFRRIGIGVISAGAYGKMVTQLFLTP
ncbi:MAG: hypothetical protein E6H88_12025 [Chloroflexi bacterium]|nr:MAG: hypothetical protein E6H88_12025 [Chloroflexota bacterium]